MTRYRNLTEAMQALAGKTDVNQLRALSETGVAWSLGSQSRDAEKERALARIAAIFARTRLMVTP